MSKKIKVVFSPREQGMILDCIHNAIEPTFTANKKAKEELADLYQKWVQHLGEEVTTTSIMGKSSEEYFSASPPKPKKK